MSLNIQSQVKLAELTTLQVGGVAEHFLKIDSEILLDDAVGYARENSLDLTVLGGGSNMLVSDTGIQGLVVHMQMKGITQTGQGSEVLLTACAGESLDDVVAYAVEHGYWGLENLSHIPGTVGAAPVQNVGAYGVEMHEIIKTVRVYNTDARKYEMLTAEECTFGYRDSLFKKPEGKKYIVTSVTFVLTTNESPQLAYRDLQERFSSTKPSLSTIRAAVIEIRSSKFPDWKTVGTAGSFFKNPVVSQEKYQALRSEYSELPGFDMGDDKVKIPLGWILDKVLHLKGQGTDQVGTYQGQALVLINRGDACATDIQTFADGIIEKVDQELGVKVQWEVTKVGF